MLHLEHYEKTKTYSTISGIFLVLALFALVASGLMKIFGVPATIAEINALGLEGWTFYLGVIEIIIAALFYYRKTMVIGFGIASAYFGGAVAAIAANQQLDPFPPLIVLGVIWVATYLRRPSLLES